MNAKHRINIIGSYLGLVGPIYYAVLIVLLGVLHPSYSHLRDQLSELGAHEAPYAFVFNWFGMAVLGASTIALSISLNNLIKRIQLGWLGPAFLAFGGSVLIAIGALPCDPGCDNFTAVARLHQSVSIGLFALSLAPVLFAIRMDKDPDWNRLVGLSLAISVFSIATDALFGLSPGIGLGRFMGLLQRTTVGAILLWKVIAAYNAVKLQKRSDVPYLDQSA